MSIYHMINWFFMFSFLGYLLECIVLTYENRMPIFNRGFVHGPFCIIYGFGALGAYLLLRPLADQPLKLYFATMAMATTMEVVTATLMIRLFGSFWWDYSRKPFNYKGMICLESSLAWGFLGIFFFRFLNGFVHQITARVPRHYEKGLAMCLVILYLVDFIYTVREQLRESLEGDGESVIGRLKLY
ncbi:MAG: putative ABC transporter permease [Hungatella sp.]